MKKYILMFFVMNLLYNPAYSQDDNDPTKLQDEKVAYESQKKYSVYGFFGHDFSGTSDFSPHSILGIESYSKSQQWSVNAELTHHFKSSTCSELYGCEPNSWDEDPKERDGDLPYKANTFSLLLGGTRYLGNPNESAVYFLMRFGISFSSGRVDGFLDDSAIYPTFQMGLGVSHTFSDTMSVGAEYRFGGGGTKYETIDGTEVQDSLELATFGLILGIKF